MLVAHGVSDSMRMTQIPGLNFFLPLFEELCKACCGREGKCVAAQEAWPAALN